MTSTLTASESSYISHLMYHFQVWTSTYGFLLRDILLGVTFFIKILDVLYTLVVSIVHFLTTGSWCVLGFLLDLGV